MISFNKKIVEFRQNSAQTRSALVTGTYAEPELPDVFMFKTKTSGISPNEIYVSFNPVNGNTAWELRDTDLDVVVIDSTGVQMDNTVIDERVNEEEPNRVGITITRDDTNWHNYMLTGTHHYAGVAYYAEGESPSLEDLEGVNVTQIAEADVTIINYSRTISSYFFWCENANLVVPEYLPRHITTIEGMFAGSNFFNQDISNWNTSNVTDMSGVFNKCTLFNRPIGKWNTSRVLNMSNMFKGSLSFNQPLKDWDMTAVHSISAMFENAVSFNQPLSKWNTSNIEMMDKAFSGAIAFNQPLGAWNVSSVTDMYEMFQAASVFNQDLSPWCVTNITSKPGSFDRYADLWTEPRPVWGTCPVPVEPEIPDPDPDPVDPVDPTDPPGPVTPELEPEDVIDTSELQDFDYALLRYRWKQEGGRDLDTRTYMQVPYRVDNMVGWAMRSSDERYLIWNNDNTGQGVESILLDVKQLATDFPDEPVISVALRAFWYSTKRTGNLSIEFATYKGGRMIASGYDWANVGGTAVQLLSINTHTPIQRSSAKERGQHLATLNFDPIANTGELVKITEFTGYAQGGNLGAGPSINGSGSSTGPVSGSTAPGDTSGGNNGDYGDYDETTGGTGVVPPIPSASEGAEFKVTIPDHAPETKLAVSVYGIVGEWALFESGRAIAGTNYTTTGVTKETSSTKVVVNVEPMKDVIKSYKLVADAESVRIQFGDYNTHAKDCDFELFTYLPTATEWAINAREATLKIPRDLPSRFTSMANMFIGSANFNQDITHWDTSNITSMSETFNGCVNFNQDISGWDTSNVTDMYGMFRETKKFNQDIGGWDVSNVTQMSNMFYYAMAFNQDLDRWNTASLVNITSMFSSTELFDGKIGTWDVSKVESLNSVFRDSKAFNQDLDGWDTSSVTMMYETFKNAAAFNGNISTWNTSNITNMYRTFYETGAFNSDIGAWDVSQVTDMSYMFEDAAEFNKDIGRWNPISVTDMDRMFYKAGRFNQDLSLWCVPNISSPYDFSYNAYRWGLPKPVWGTCPRGENGGPVSPDSNIPAGLDFTIRSANGWNNELVVWLTDVTGDWAMYSGSVLVYSQAKLGSSVTVDAAAKKVKIRIPTGTYAKTFRLVGDFKGIEMSIPRGSNDNRTSSEFTLHKFSPTVSSYKFALEGTDIEIQDSLPAVVTTLRDMFKGSDLFNTDISTWNVTNVTNMRGVFDGCSYFNVNLSPWDVSNVTDMVNMFSGCFNFNQDLSSWNVTNIQRKPIGFSPNNSKWILPKPIWGTNAGVGDVPPVVQGGETDTCVIKITNTDTSLAAPLEVTTQIYKPGSVWSVKDLDTGVVVASNTKPTSTDPRIVCSKDSSFLNVKSISPVADTKRYAITASGTSASINCRPANGSNVTAHGVIELESFSNQVGAYTFSVDSVDLIVPNYLPTNIKTLKQMFYYAGAFNQDLSTWNTANVTNMDSVFLHCKYFDGDVSTWDTSNVTTMSNMFKGCVRFNSDLSNWNVSKVTKFNLMLNDCTRFSSDLSGWRPVAGTDFNNMFRECVNFNSDLSEWTVDSGINFSAMFYNCKKFNQDLSNWKTDNATDMSYMFENADMLGQDLSTWCVGKIRNAPSGFMRYSVENRYNSPVWGTCPIKGMGFMLQSDDSVQSDVPFILSATNVASNWTLKCNDVLIASATYTAPNVSVEGDVDIKITLSNLRNKSLDYVLRANSDCVTLGDPTYESYIGTRIVKVKSFYNQIRSYKFRVGDDLLTVPDKLPLIITTLNGMFEGCINFNQNISGWNTSIITDMSNMFKGCVAFNRTLSAWDVRLVTDMSGMFWGCTTFNQDLSAWKHTNVTTMKNMFRDCHSFNRPLNTWVVNKVTDMSYMFYNCRMFNQDIGNWLTYNVVDMSYMFYGCEVYNKVIETWDTVSVTDMSHMFDGCSTFNQVINFWEVGSVSNFDYMFNNCTNYNQPLDLWCVQSVVSKPTGFDNGTSSWSKSRPVWGTCPLTGMVFTTQSTTADTEIKINISVNYDAAAWSLVDLDTGQVVANQTGPLIDHNNIYVNNNEVGLNRRGRTRARYMLKGRLKTAKLTVNGWFEDTEDSITIEQFSYTIDNHQFVFDAIKHATVPSVLPRHITSLHHMFYNCNNFNQDLSGWDTSNVTDMSHTFSRSVYNQPIGTWDTSNVVSFASMFHDNLVFNQDLSQWNTGNAVTLADMFHNAVAFDGNIDNWDTSKVTTLQYFCHNATAFNSDISGWDVSKVTSLYSTFARCVNFNCDISGWDVSRVGNFEWTFYNATSFNQDLSQWCTVIAGSRTYFSDSATAWVLPQPVWGTCPRLEIQPPKPVVPQPVEQLVTQVPEAIVSTTYKFSTTNVLNPEMRLPISIAWGDSYRPFILKENGVVIANYNTGEYGEGVSSESYNLYIKTKVGGVNNYELTTTNTSVQLRYGKVGEDELAVEGEVTVEAFSSTVSNFQYDLPCVKLKVPDQIPNTITSMNDMFDGCTLFNQNINTWDVSRVTSMSDTFSRCKSYNQPVSNWNTSSVQSMYRMFSKCDVFNQHLNNWNVSNVTNMGHMFNDALVFDAELDNWDTGKVTTMSGMFQNATFFNQDISMWDTSKVTSISSMFAGAYYFNQDLSGWCVGILQNDYYYSAFDWRAVAWTKPKPVWGTCPTKPMYFPIDITGTSGIYLTISKNNGPYVTFNLADPEMDKATFTNMIVLGQNNASAAFFDYPGITLESGTDFSKVTGLCGIRLDGKLTTPDHPDGFEITTGFALSESIVVLPPYNVSPERNKLSIKATPGVDKSLDIYYSIPGVTEHGSVSTYSAAVINFAP